MATTHDFPNSWSEEGETFEYEPYMFANPYDFKLLGKVITIGDTVNDKNYGKGKIVAIDPMDTFGIHIMFPDETGELHKYSFAGSETSEDDKDATLFGINARRKEK